MIDLFPPDRYDAIITNAGGCGSHLRRYGPLLADDPAYAERARAWDGKLRDVHEWLGEIGCRAPQPQRHAGREPDFTERGTVVAYHDSCHLVHGQKIAHQPRALLALIPGVTLVPLPESTWCCGAAGVYAITQPQQADLLLARKVQHIVETGAGVLATANPGCQLQIARGLDASGSGIRVVHPVSLLAAAYRDGVPEHIAGRYVADRKNTCFDTEMCENAFHATKRANPLLQPTLGADSIPQPITSALQLSISRQVRRRVVPGGWAKRGEIHRSVTRLASNQEFNQ